MTVVVTGRKRAAVFMSWNMKVPLDARKCVDVRNNDRKLGASSPDLEQNQKSNV